MSKTKFFLWLLPLVVVLFNSCIKENYETNIYGNSMLWISVDSSSVEAIDKFEIKFKTKDVYGVEKEHQISYTKNGGFVTEGNLSFPTTMKGGWQKVYEGLDETDSIIIVYNGNKYITRGYKFPEQRCIKINWRTTSVEGEFDIKDFDIEIIEQEIEIANLNQQNYEKSNFFFSTLLCCNFGCNGARFQNIC